MTTPSIPMTLVHSSQIFAIGHDSSTNTLAVQFPKREKGKIVGGGPVYHYLNVPTEMFERFMAAESKGLFFGTEITLKVDDHPFVKFVPAEQ
jgi:hypothetical protein